MILKRFSMNIFTLVEENFDNQSSKMHQKEWFFKRFSMNIFTLVEENFDDQCSKCIWKNDFEEIMVSSRFPGPAKIYRFPQNFRSPHRIFFPRSPHDEWCLTCVLDQNCYSIEIVADQMDEGRIDNQIIHC